MVVCLELVQNHGDTDKKRKQDNLTVGAITKIESKWGFIECGTSNQILCFQKFSYKLHQQFRAQELISHRSLPVNFLCFQESPIEDSWKYKKSRMQVLKSLFSVCFIKKNGCKHFIICVFSSRHPCRFKGRVVQWIEQGPGKDAKLACFAHSCTVPKVRRQSGPREAEIQSYWSWATLLTAVIKIRLTVLVTLNFRFRASLGRNYFSDFFFKILLQ